MIKIFFQGDNIGYKSVNIVNIVDIEEHFYDKNFPPR